MSESTSEQRRNWQAFECRKDQMDSIAFGPDRILVAPPTCDAWAALANVLLAHNYDLRTPDTDSYNCREIKGGGGRSLHSYGIALDVNWQTNPFKRTPDKRKVVFSTKATQAERAEEVRRGISDTDMTPAMIDDVLAIKTNSGKRVFEWGGNWHNVKDAMHFEIDVTPADLASGIDQGTVKQPPPDASWGTPRGALAGDDSVLAQGAEGPRVRALQAALAQRNFPVGEIDGDFGPKTLAALRAFQTAQGLQPTGIGDSATLAALGLAAAPTPPPDQSAAALIDQLLKIAAPAAPAAAAAPAVPPNLTADLLAVLLGKPPGATPEAAKAMQDAVMSPVDKVLGGEALTGKKTALSVIAYALLSVLQGAGAAPVVNGTPSTTGEATVQILSTLIIAFGGLGLIGKVDRAINLVGLAAAGARAGADKPG